MWLQLDLDEGGAATPRLSRERERDGNGEVEPGRERKADVALDK